MIRYPTSDTVPPRAPGEHGTVDIVVRKDQIVVIDMIGIGLCRSSHIFRSVITLFRSQITTHDIILIHSNSSLPGGTGRLKRTNFVMR